MNPQPENAIAEAEKAGFDMSLVEENLKLTPIERIRRHDQALALVLALTAIREERNAKLGTPAPTPR